MRVRLADVISGMIVREVRVRVTSETTEKRGEVSVEVDEREEEIGEYHSFYLLAASCQLQLLSLFFFFQVTSISVVTWSG